MDWSESSYEVTSGHHVLKWEFAKDGYVDGGQDCAWLDFVIMPVINGLEPATMMLDQTEINFELDPGETASSSLNISNNGEADLIYEIMVNYPLMREYGGPDNFGYFWFDSNSASGPEYNWIDIEAEGTLLSFTDNDTGTDLMPIGFTFEYYGEEYDEFLVNPNGWIGFGDDNDEWLNTHLPNPSAPTTAILGFWDDLRPWNGSQGGGNVYYHSNDERLVVWYDNVEHYGGDNVGVFDFEIIIYPEGNILVQYRNMVGNLEAATVGFQNENGTDGLQIVYNDSYITNELAIEIKYIDTWLDLDQMSGCIEAGNTDQITLSVNTGDMESGTYNCDLIITSNDPENLTQTVPVELVITGTEGEDNLIPSVTELKGNYPNPFNPETNINFNTSQESNVKITVFNIKGQKVTTLVDEIMPAGVHSISWNGKDENDRSVTSGVYFYTMEAGKYHTTKKMMLLK